MLLLATWLAAALLLLVAGLLLLTFCWLGLLLV